MNILQYFLILFLSIVLYPDVGNCYQVNNDESFLDGHITLQVEDSFTNSIGSFTHRSQIHIPSVRSGHTAISHSRKWTPADIEDLKAAASDDGFYFVRIRQDGQPENNFLLTFTKACLMYESELSETLVLMLDSSATTVIGVSLYPKASVCENLELTHFPSQFNTTVITRSPIPAPVPDTATFIQKIEAMKSEKAEGKDNRSFISKYWMYIVPVVLLMLISGGAQEPPK